MNTNGQRLLIDLNELDRFKVKEDGQHVWRENRNETIEKIQREATIIDPTVYGEWIMKDGNGNGVCSVCNKQDNIDPLATHCRYCGAKMRKLAKWFDVGSLSCRCDNCGCKHTHEAEECPHCGAKMEVSHGDKRVD